MKALVLAYGRGDAASTVYRYRACQNLWAMQGHELIIAPVSELSSDFWSQLPGCDVVINQKALLPLRFQKRLQAAGRPIFFDFDDSIWTRPRKPYSWWTQLRVNRRIRHWFSAARRIFAANQHLADFARRYNSTVDLVPTALDLGVWRPRTGPPRNEVVIGWLGSPGNVWYLESIREPLRKILAANPHVRLVVCSPPPAFDFPFERVPFVPGKEQEFVASLDIGLLPLRYEPYTLGKSPVKSMQYLSCAVPVVGNVSGATAEILNPENSLAVNTDADWVAALQRLVDSPIERERLGAAGRRHVEQHHDLQEVSARLLKILLA